MRAQRTVAFTVALAIAHSAFGAVRGENAQYLGGTAPIPKDARGTFDFGEYPWKSCVYRYDGGTFALPSNRITALEYGDKVGRRIGSALALGLTVLNPLLALTVALSKKEKHFLTVGYTQDDGKPGAMVFELPKKNAWSTVRRFEAATMLRAEEVNAGRVIAAKDAPPVKAAVVAPAPAAPVERTQTEPPKPAPQQPPTKPVPPPAQEEKAPGTYAVELPAPPK